MRENTPREDTARVTAAGVRNPGVLRGVYVPLVTPFAASGAVDHAALERLAQDCLQEGAAGLVALATTGEPTSLDAAERDAVVTTCARMCAEWGSGLLVGAGTNNTRTTMARHDALADIPVVTASLAVVPYYVRPSESAIVAHFQLVAAHSPVPLVIYNIPYRTGAGLGIVGPARFSRHRQRGQPQTGRRWYRRRHPAGARRSTR